MYEKSKISTPENRVKLGYFSQCMYCDPLFIVFTIKNSILTNLRVLTSNMTIVFQNSIPKIPQ